MRRSSSREVVVGTCSALRLPTGERFVKCYGCGWQGLQYLVGLVNLKVGFGVKARKNFGALTPQVPESRLAQRVVEVELTL